MHWQASVGILRLNIVYVTDYKPSLDVYMAVPPVEIAPLQPDEFTGSESEARSNDAHGTDRFFQVIQKKPKFIWRQDPWLLQSFGRTFHPHQADWIHSVQFDQFSFHRPIEQDVHDASNMPLAFRRKIETHKPLLYQQWLDF